MDLFAHRIHRATLIGGNVRLECSVLRPDANGKIDAEAVPAPGEESFSLTLPARGFMRSMATLREVMQEMQQSGMMQQRGGEEGDRAGRPAPGDKGTKGLARGKNREMLDITKSGDDEQIV